MFVFPVTVKDPVISALPSLVPSHSVATPVNPEPSPTKDPEKIDPEIAATFVKSTTSVDPETVNEPVMFAFPKWVPSHSNPVRLDPSP